MSQISALLKSRVRRPSYLKKLAKAEDLLHHFPNGAYVGWSGFTGVGYPKYASIAVSKTYSYGLFLSFRSSEV